MIAHVVALAGAVLATDGGPSMTLQDRCALVEAALAAEGAVPFGGEAVPVKSFARRVPASSRVGGKIVVDARWTGPRHAGQTLFAKERCPQGSFVALDEVRASSRVPAYVVRIELRPRANERAAAAVDFVLRLVVGERPPQGWFAAAPVPVYRGHLEREREVWVGKVVRVAGR